MCPRSRSLPPLPLLSHSLPTPTFNPLRPEEGTHPLTTFLEDGNHFHFTPRFFRRGQKLRGTVSSISSGVIVLVRNSAHAHYPLFFREDLNHGCCCSLTEFQPVKYFRSVSSFFRRRERFPRYIGRIRVSFGSRMDARAVSCKLRMQGRTVNSSRSYLFNRFMEKLRIIYIYIYK